MNRIKCYICGKPTEFAYRPDIDMEGVPICDPRESECMLELLEKLNEELNI